MINKILKNRKWSSPWGTWRFFKILRLSSELWEMFRPCWITDRNRLWILRIGWTCLGSKRVLNASRTLSHRRASKNGRIVGRFHFPTGASTMAQIRALFRDAPMISLSSSAAFEDVVSAKEIPPPSFFFGPTSGSCGDVTASEIHPDSHWLWLTRWKKMGRRDWFRQPLFRCAANIHSKASDLKKPSPLRWTPRVYLQ